MTGLPDAENFPDQYHLVIYVKDGIGGAWLLSASNSYTGDEDRWAFTSEAKLRRFVRREFGGPAGPAGQPKLFPMEADRSFDSEHDYDE